MRGDPFTIESAIGTGVFAILGCFFVALIIKGGTNYLEVNDEAIYWRNVFEGETTIEHADVESISKS